MDTLKKDPETEVAPSRGRGSKPSSSRRGRSSARRSPLRGGVDRNNDADWVGSSDLVAPSRGRGSKRRYDACRGGGKTVAPSRGRGSKRGPISRSTISSARRPFAGAWIETGLLRASRVALVVAPSRGRGSKQARLSDHSRRGESPLRGGVDRNNILADKVVAVASRPFAGAWIETPIPASGWTRRHLAPSRGRGSKQPLHHHHAPGNLSPLRGGVDRNFCWFEPFIKGRGRPFAGAWIETRRMRSCPSDQSSPLRGGVDRNIAGDARIWLATGRPFAGAWIETCASC